MKEKFMREAIRESQKAFERDEVPIGCVIVKDGKIIARAHNRKEEKKCATAHAEILAIEKASRKTGDWRLDGCEMYVTLEPCPMCAGAMVMAQLERCFFAARDQRQGCCESVLALTQDPAFYHRVPCVGGLMEEEAQTLLQDFFAKRRTGDKHHEH